MTITITFPQPAERLMSNDRGHWTRRARLARAWRTAAQSAAYVELGLPKARRRQPACFVRVTFPVKVDRRRDSDGPAPTVKAIVDGLVDAGLWSDDTPEFVETLGSRFAKGTDVVTVELIPRGDGL